MAFSSLAIPYFVPTKSSPRNHVIDTITIHCMTGQGSVEGCGNLFRNSAQYNANGFCVNGASSNYGIGYDGRIGCYVDENDRSWCTGGSKIGHAASAANDNRAITIEVASDNFHPFAVKSAAMGALIALLIDICYRNNIWELKWRGDPGLIGQVDKQNMTVHRWFAYKECPGDYLYERMGQIAADVNQQLHNITGFREKIARGTVGRGYEEGQSTPRQGTNTGSSGSSGSRGSSGSGSIGSTKPGMIWIPRDNEQGGTWIPATTSPIQSSIIDYSDKLICKGYAKRPGDNFATKITVHSAFKVGNLDDLAVLMNSSDVVGSEAFKAYNYGIDNDGNIGLFVDEDMVTYSCGDSAAARANDEAAVNIICMNEETEPDQSLTAACWNSLVLLCADVCRRNAIERLVYTGNPETDTLTKHSAFQRTTVCPGEWLSRKMYDLADTVNRYIKNGTGTEINQLYLEALKDMGTITVRNNHPYLIKINEGALNTDYPTLKAIGVVGALINAGQRFDEMHNEVHYRSETVYEQADEAIEAGFPYGFFYTTHARTIAEVREEAYWFYFVISKYPPKLGAWIRCQFDVDTDIASELIDKWYEYLTDWGLKSKCGLYCTKEQAELIGWPRQSTYMPLWLEQDETVSAAPDEEILLPSFFAWMKVAGTSY